MRHTYEAAMLLAARELGVVKSNADFWKNYPTKADFTDKLSDTSSWEDIERAAEKYVQTFDSAEDCETGIVCAYDKSRFPLINAKVTNKSEKPMLLGYRGDFSLLEELNKNIAAIGLIDPDDDIMSRGRSLVEEIMGSSGDEIRIVSGLARGCDTVAHETCLKCSGKTIAILPTPLNRIYPKENRALADEIVDRGGLLLTEYFDFDRQPGKFDAVKRFVDRDRLQAMFSKAVVLLASYDKGEGDSGSRHAMDAARKYGLARYVMYNRKTDENRREFGLNRRLLGEDAKIATRSNIGILRGLKNPDLEMPVTL